MRATSAYEYFTPEVARLFEMLGFCHHPRRPLASCAQCQLGAEAIFQRVMARWEAFLVEVLVDQIQGLPNGHSQSKTPVRKPMYANRHDALDGVLSTKKVNGNYTHSGPPRDYILLHDPDVVTNIVRHWLPGSDMETAISSNAQAIRRLLKIRHGLSHGTDHAQREMRNVLMHFEPLKTYTTVGEFLLDRANPADPHCWLDNLCEEICLYASRVSP